MSLVGVVGLGVMGSAMARRLAGAGHEVRGFDIDPGRVSGLSGAEVLGCRTMVDMLDHVDLLVLSLPDDAAVVEVAVDVASIAKEGLVCIDTSTTSLEAKTAARETLAMVGVGMVDAPVSGTGIQAAEGALVVMASGDTADLAKAVPVFDAIGSKTHQLGEFGNGTRMKWVANHLVAVHNLATAEAHALAAALGLDPELVQRVVGDGVGSSRIFEIRGPKIVERDYSPTVRLDLVLKDCRLIKEQAMAAGVPTPLLDVAIPWYQAASDSGDGDRDPAVLFRALQGDTTARPEEHRP